jgi:branched-chain amino acid transport system permease protein
VQVIFEALITGILTGGIYALMSSGLTLIFGVMDIINIAHGILVILGAYLSYVLAQQWHIDLFLGLLISMPAMFVLGLVIEFAFIRRLKHNRIMLSILVTYAVALVIEGILTMVFSGNFVTLDAPYVDSSFPLPFIHYFLPKIYVYAFILAVILLSMLYVLLYRTTFGSSLRATMQDRTSAMLIGINVDRIQLHTFGIGVALCAAGGMAYGATTAFNPASSYDLISRLLVIIVLGGMGSISGALIGSVVLVTVGDLVAVIWSPIWSSVVFFAVLIVLLLFRPQGVFGRAEGRTV